MTERKRGGEGNREADQRYRKGVRETMKKTSDPERARKARDISTDELSKLKQAEAKGKSRKRT
ncbi:MAG TPA: hypothetical protein VFG52_07240 [Xanthomonadales bacterium]|nr:hypothetical protein [Xanthomonadales bacterium]